MAFARHSPDLRGEAVVRPRWGRLPASERIEAQALREERVEGLLALLDVLVPPLDEHPYR